MTLDDILLETEERMEKTLEVTKNEFSSIRSGKASPDLVNTISVNVSSYGSVLKLKELAAITTPDPRLIQIQPWDVSTLDDIRKALEESKIGITPVVDGKLIRLPIPQLSEERRQELVKSVRKLAEEGRVAIRSSRRYAIDEVKRIQKESKITEDDAARGEKEVQKLTDQYIAEIDKHLATKEGDLLKV